MVLRAVQFLSEEIKNLNGPKQLNKRLKLGSDLIGCIICSLKHSSSHVMQVLDMDLQFLFEDALTSESKNRFKQMEKALHCIGSLMCLEDQISIQVQSKVPDIHKLIIQNILTISLHPDKDCTNDSLYQKEKKSLVKTALWTLSNYAACPPIINEQLVEDGLLDKIIEIGF